ncbi:MAG: protein adenylyltransferase SelO family protein, partial [Pseudanabaena sp. ELA645]
LLDKWRVIYHQLLIRVAISELDNIAKQLQQANPLVIFLRPKIEEIWERIAVDDDWQPLYQAIAEMKK